MVTFNYEQIQWSDNKIHVSQWKSTAQVPKTVLLFELPPPPPPSPRTTITGYSSMSVSISPSVPPCQYSNDAATYTPLKLCHSPAGLSDYSMRTRLEKQEGVVGFDDSHARAPHFILKYMNWWRENKRTAAVTDGLIIYPHQAETCLMTKVFFQFEIVINVLVSSFRFIWIPLLWVYCHYKLLILSASTDVRFWRLKTVPDLKGLI